jgi:hypothetical protein
MEKFCAAMKKQIVIPPLKGEQVIEIVHLLKWINDEIESDNIGASGEDAIDLFNTELNILAAAEAAGTTTVTTGATATATLQHSYNNKDDDMNLNQQLVKPE